MKIIKCARASTEELIGKMNQRIQELEGGIQSSSDIEAATNSVDQIMKYYDEVSPEEACNYLQCNPEDLNNVEDLSAYNTQHVSWLLAKPEYRDHLDSYDCVEVVNEGGDVFPAIGSAGRLFDVSDEILRYMEDVDVESCSNVEAESTLGEDDTDERYLHSLIGDLDAKLEELGYAPVIEYDADRDECVYITLVDNGDHAQEFKVPFEDLSFNFDNIESDVAYIVDAIEG